MNTDISELIYVKYIGRNMDGINLLEVFDGWYTSTISPEELDAMIR